MIVESHDSKENCQDDEATELDRLAADGVDGGSSEPC